MIGLEDDLALVANVDIQVHDGGRLVRRIRRHNLITDVGLNTVRNALLGSGNQPCPTQMAVGTGTTAPAAGDTALVAEVYRALISLRTPTDKQATFQHFINGLSCNGLDITEAGLLTAAGDMLARVVFPAIAKSSTLTVTLNWSFTIGRG